MKIMCRMGIVWLLLALACVFAGGAQSGHSQLSTQSGADLKTVAAEANDLYNKHHYAEAAALLQGLVVQPNVEWSPDWPAELYNLACDQALSGNPTKALSALKKAVERGAVTYSHLHSDTDLNSLRGTDAFRRLEAQLQTEETLWGNSPAIATPYKAQLSQEERVAGLSKLWSEAKFNFAFFGRIPDLNWDARYVDYLPKVIAVQSTADYYRTLIRFAAALRDGHSNVILPRELTSQFYALPGIRTSLVDAAVLVTSVSDERLVDAGVVIGDELIAIDGEPVKQYAAEEVEPYISGYSPQFRDVQIFDYELLRGSVMRSVRLELRHAGGKTVSVIAERRPFDYKAFIGEPTQFKMLPSSIAYLAVNEFDDDAGPIALMGHFEAILSSRGLIIDLRRNGGGSSDYAYDILKTLAEHPFESSHWRTRDYKPALRAAGNAPSWYSAAGVTLDPATRPFKGPVAVLIGPRTGSAAEDFVVAFRSMKRGVTVGESTAGTTGLPLVFKLPGGGAARICTKDDSFPDGTTFEGNGIAPEVSAKPSIADFRLGKDVALEQAMRRLTTSLHGAS